MMKYVITENRMIDLVGNMVNEIYPNFSKGNCNEVDMGDEDNPEIHYFTKEDGLFAKYNIWEKELMLKKPLFFKLEDYFGVDGMVFVIDWFNKEFGQDAESVNY